VLGLLTIAPCGGVLKGDTTGCMEVLTMDFSLIDYLDEGACYTKLVELLHPDGLACPRCGERQRLGSHRCHRAPLVDFQCGTCGRVFNAFTATPLRGTHRRPAPLLMILRGLAQGTPTAQMARELGCDRKELLGLGHRLQERARIGLDRNPLDDEVVEADEMYQNAGEKRHRARRPRRPAAAARQQPEGPRHLRDRPAAGRRGGRSRVG
jgi:transposase-like protein